MSITKETCTVVQLEPTIGRIISQLAKKNTELTAKKLQDMPRRFTNESLKFYFTVLNVVTGRLRKEIARGGFSRQVGTDSMEYGMRAEVNYAAIQHEGGDVPERFPVKAKAMRWIGPGGKPIFAKRARGFHITAKHFFSIPMVNVANEVIDELKKEIDF